MGRMLATLGARSFHAAAPTSWNSLPAHIREIELGLATKIQIFFGILEIHGTFRKL